MLELFLGVLLSGPADPLPELRIDHDNTVIDHSCRVVIAEDRIIEDKDRNGVLQIASDGLTVEFAPDSVLRGAGPDTPDDVLEGTGILIRGHKGVTIRNARVEGYRSAILAAQADDLTIDSATISRGFRQRLYSTPRGEVAADWLWPHRNDDREWIATYGAAVCIEDSSNVTVRGVKVRNTQNGIILDRVRGSRVFDNDCSFLSGWGLAMWRSGKNTVSRNAFDYCIRGYSHGVYNRGQDSAGILVFEQCSDNQFLENSATHCGDGFFCFAGREALGQTGQAPSGGFEGAGCNRNILRGNDFSFAAAHGVELTFGFDNWIIGNRVDSNAICGVWGGYSQRTHILHNDIRGNGSPGAREGGGVNIEHGFRNVIASNRFADNSIDIALWDDEDAGLRDLPWSKTNHRGSTDNLIGECEWSDLPRPIRLRQTPITRMDPDAASVLDRRIDADDVSILKHDPASELDAATPPSIAEPIGDSRPVGARADLGGREAIFIGEWGPWDHVSPMLRLLSRDGSRDRYDLFGDVGSVALIGLDGAGDVGAEFSEPVPGMPRGLLVGTRPGVVGLRPYEFRVQAEGIDHIVRGTLLTAPWAFRMFSWDANSDPRTDLPAWRKVAAGPFAVAFSIDSLGPSAGWLDFGSSGPRQVPFLAEFRDRLPGPDRFGIIATSRFDLPAGRWQFTTRSDDGVRVLVNGNAIIENWTHHAAAEDHAVFVQEQSEIIDVTIEYFEIDGLATLDFHIDPAPPAGAATPVP